MGRLVFFAASSAFAALLSGVCPASAAPRAARLPALAPALSFSPPFQAAARLLSAAGRRYGIEPDPQAVADLGEGDFGQVRSGVMPLEPPRALGARLPAAPGEPIAVKILYEDPGGMAAREGNVSRRLEDAGGGPLFLRATHDPQLGVLVMENLRGYKPIDEWAAGARVIDARVAGRIAEQLQRALAVLDEAGLVHSDLKPDNVLVGPRLRVKIVDFGLTAEKGGHPPYPGFERWRGGHHAYVSANQRRGGPASVKDDRYAVGVLLRKLRGLARP